MNVARLVDVLSARVLPAVCFSASLSAIAASGVALAQASFSNSASAPNASAGKQLPPAAAAGNGKIAPKAATVKPLWTELTPPQQLALAPLAGEWDRLDSIRKKKWLEIGNKFSTMTSDQQSRIQGRMRDWVKLTPEQRRIARENYARAKKINPDQKYETWRQYQQLPEEQKKKLASEATSKKQVANLPSSAQRKQNIIPPIKPSQKIGPGKSAPTPPASPIASQPVLQQTPQPAAQSSPK